MIPHDDFTPHGYLDNPSHFWKLNPCGALRSLPPLGMGWHVPNLGSYVLNQFQYTAHVTVGLNMNDLVLVTPDDFRLQRSAISSSIHTAHRFGCTCQITQYDLTMNVCYFLVQEHVLGCRIELSSALDYPLQLTCYLTHLHTHNPHPAASGSTVGTRLLIARMGTRCRDWPARAMRFYMARAVSATPLNWGDSCLCEDLAQVSA